MNKKIKNEAAFGIIIILVSTLSLLLWSVNKQKTNQNKEAATIKEQPVLPVENKANEDNYQKSEKSENSAKVTDSGSILKKSEKINIYSNKLYNFSFEYSSDRIYDPECYFGGKPIDNFCFFTKSEYADYQEALKNPAPIGGPSLFIAIFDSMGLKNIEEWFSKEFNESGLNKKKVVIDGIEGEKIIMPGAYADPEVFNSAYVIKGKYVYEITADSEKNLDAYLKTFKFLSN